MRNRLLLSSFALAVLAIAVPASAQTFKPRQSRPEWAVFGSGVSKTEQRLILTATFGGGFEDDLSKTPPPADDGTTPPTYYSGPYGAAGATLKYTVDKKNVFGDAQFGADGRSYGDMTDPFIGTYSANGHFSFAVGKKGSADTTGWAGQYLYNLSPLGYSGGASGVPPPPSNSGAAVTGDTYRGFGASASYNYSFTTRFTGYAGYSYYANDSYSSVTSNGKYDSQGASAGVRYALGKGVGLRAGYATALGGFYAASNPLEYRNRTIDAGVDYNKSLSPSRKSTLSFGTGLSGVIDAADDVHYYFIGHVNFNQEIGRTWSAFATLNRDVNFFQTLGQPTVSDWVSAGFNGLIGRHVDVQTGISYWNGSAIGSNAHVYDSTSAFVSTNIGLNRIMALGATYSYYRYVFSDNVPVLPPGFVRQTDRQVFQVSLIIWVPLVTRAPAQSRSANASR